MIKMKRIWGKSTYVDTMRTGLAIISALAIVGIIVFIISTQPFDAMRNFILGPLSSVRRMGNVIEGAVPLMFTGLAVIMLQRTGLFNLAMEGGFFVGAVIATAVALSLQTPALITLLLACISGAIAGAITCSIPTVLKVKCDANVLVTSLMLNYICLHLGLYVILRFFQDPTQNAAVSFPFPEGVSFGQLFSQTRINSGIFVVLFCIVLIWLLLNRTSFGYKVTMVGKNQTMAEYAGIKVNRYIVGSSLIGGLLAGLGGAVDVLGMSPRFQYTGLTGFGWDGILIAILARHKAQFVPVAALFLGYMRTGAEVMAIRSDIPVEVIRIIQAIVIVLISAQALLSGYRKKLVIQEANDEKELA